MSVEVHQLSKTYKQLKAVDQISFTAESGKILGFLGPNGAGKSTTMKILSCFIPPSTGSARICGFDILDHPIEVRSHIGYLPEHNPLYLDLYVQESLHFIASIHQIANREQRIADVIEQVGLGSEQRKKIADLSKGYRQRVGLAQAILHNPQVLILDEPTSGLDPNQIIGIRSLIKELGKTKTIILSTHIMQEVEAVCDQIIIINKGQIVENQTIQSLKQTYKGKTLEEIFILKTNY
ncbi:MAG: ATP-binding cassette domain-containing protein [Sphingobacteriaceae bacterium]|nr:MAG: ATP-binding cassette domain-containing protein [Pedobacter sp.]